MRYPNAGILVMARAPVAGEAKTRLIPALGAEGAATLHAYLVERLLDELSRAAIAPITLCCTPGVDHPFFSHCAERYEVALQPQRGSDLGERLHFALESSLKQHKVAVVVGCDIPLLAPAAVIEAIASVVNGSSAALSPTEDGGYALLAVRQAAVELFRGVEWGGAEVVSQTRERLRGLGWQWHELEMLWDVDRPEDLRRLAQLQLPSQIVRLLVGSSAPG
jgi:rSAM/selenodomain-associated transferase 1